MTKLRSARHFAVAPVAARTLDGIVFDSKGEMVRWASLTLLQKAGHIRNLKRQVLFHCQIVGKDGRLHEIRKPWPADFTYEEKQRDGSWALVVEDAKAVDNNVALITRKLMKALHGFDVRVVKV